MCVSLYMHACMWSPQMPQECIIALELELDVAVRKAEGRRPRLLCSAPRFPAGCKPIGFPKAALDQSMGEPVLRSALAEGGSNPFVT